MNFSRNLISYGYEFVKNTQLWQNEQRDQHSVFLQNDYIIHKHDFFSEWSGNGLFLLGLPDLFLPKIHNHLLFTVLLFILVLGPCTGEGHSPFRLALKLFCPLLLGILRGKVHIPGCGEIELAAFCPMEVDGVSIRLAAMLWTKGGDVTWGFARAAVLLMHRLSSEQAVRYLMTHWRLKRTKNKKWTVVFYLSWPSPNDKCILVSYLLPYKCTSDHCKAVFA